MKKSVLQFKWIFAVAIITFNSCKKGDSPIQSVTDSTTSKTALDALLGLNASGSFNYEMEKSTALDITILAPDNTPVANIPVNILDKAEELGGIVLFKAMTDDNGKIAANVKLSTSISQVVIDPKYAGVIRNAAVNIVSSNVSCTLGGTKGYSGNVVLNSPLTGGRFTNYTTANQREMSPASPYSFMGSFDNTGKPGYLEPTNEIITADFLKNINASLPEGKTVMASHPDYLASNVQTNASITQLSDVWMTFVSEGAGYRNTIAFFTYPTNNPPQKPSDIDSLHIILPNASLSGSGGSLVSGNTIKLGRFNPGTSIGFALIADAWNGTTVGNGLWTVYSIDKLNPEADVTLKRHSVFLYDNAQKLFLVGMEDVKRDLGTDNDFNDCLFYLKSNPVTGISVENVNPIDKPVDTDKDGVNDVYDDFPNDPTRAYINYYPSAATTGTIAFEDYWPFLGDYDMNDLVVDYKYAVVSNAANKVVEMKSQYFLEASGASYKNGFGVQFPFAPSLVKSTTGGLVTNNNVVNLNANGCEAGQSKAVIIPFDNAYSAMNVNGGFNTSAGKTTLTRDTISMMLTFTRPLALSELGLAPFNPFIIINGTRGREAHLAGNVPTDKVDTKYFKTGVDITDPLKGIYYKTSTNLPWGLSLTDHFGYPDEQKAINTAYLNFEPWVRSAGVANTNWYKDSATMVKANIHKR
jgi:LruC domain-containing protein